MIKVATKKLGNQVNLENQGSDKKCRKVDIAVFSLTPLVVLSTTNTPGCRSFFVGGKHQQRAATSRHQIICLKIANFIVLKDMIAYASNYKNKYS